MKNKDQTINIKNIPHMLHKNFKAKCGDAGTSMTAVQMRLMEIVKDGEVVLEKSGNIRFRKEGEGQQEKMLALIKDEMVETFLAGVEEDREDFVSASKDSIKKYLDSRCVEVVKKICKI